MGHQHGAGRVMRRAMVVLLAAVLLMPMVPAQATGDEGPVAGAGPLPTRHLVDAAKALDRGNTTAANGSIQQAREAFEDRFAAYSREDASAVRRVLDDLANETEPVAFRSKIHRFEVALLSMAAGNVDRFLDDDRHGRAHAWLRVAERSVDAPGRSLPFARVEQPLRAGQDPSPTDVATAFDAAAAFRMLEEVQSADDLQAAGDPAWGVHVDRARIWWDLVRPRARDRLPPAASSALEGNVTRLASLLSQRDEPGPLPGIRGPLTALAYHRSIERLDEVGAGVEAGIYGLHRTVHRDPPAVPVRREAFLADYGRHRQFLGIGGEGPIQPLDRAVLALNRSVANGTGVARATGEAADRLREVALLEYGVVLKVDHLAVRHDRVHKGKVTLLRPPLEGLASYRVRIAYDPGTVAVVEVEPRRFARNFSHDVRNGTVAFGGEEERFASGAHVALLHLEAVGDPLEKTGLNVTFHRFTTVHGEEAEVLLVRDGAATVAKIETGDGDDGNETGPPTPGMGLAGLAAAASVALWLRGRR